MKNLANCSGIEFLKQTNKIRHEVQEFLTVTKIMDIRKRKPVLKIANDSMTEEEKAQIEAENKEAKRKQAKKNLSDMLDAMLDENADKTLDVLGLLCFMNHEEVSKLTGSELMQNWGELLSDKGVIDFFVSLTNWGVMNISG